MILRELLYKGPQDAIKILIKLFIKNGLLLIKIIKKTIYGEVFHWFILLIKLINC